MKLKAIVHEAEEGGYWAEVPAIPGCSTQGDAYEELMTNFTRSHRRLFVGRYGANRNH